MTAILQAPAPLFGATADRAPSSTGGSRWADHLRAAPIAFLAGLSAVLLVPQIGYLGLTLPTSYTTTNWSGTWQGLDVALAVALAATALGTWRRWSSTAMWACSAGVLMLADAWFDLSLTAAGSDRLWSVASAFIEVPLALLMLRHGHRTIGTSAEPAASARPL